MSLQDQIIPIAFGQGLDTKTDAKAVGAGKTLRLQDAVFTQAKQVNKRNGYGKFTKAILNGGTLVSPTMVKTFRDELVCADSGLLYSYSPTQQAWVPKGNYAPVAVSNTVISDAGGMSHVGTCGAILGNIAVFAWVVNSVPMACIIDMQTGTQLVSEFVLSSAPSSIVEGEYLVVQCLVVAGNTLAVLYHNSSKNICMRTILTSTGQASFSSEILIIPETTSLYPYKAVGSSSGFALAFYGYDGDNSLFLASVAPSGAIGGLVPVDTAASQTPFTVIQDPANGNLWVYYCEGINAYYSVYSSNISPLLAKTAITSAPSGGYWLSFTAAPASGSQTFLGTLIADTIPVGETTIVSAQVSSSGSVTGVHNLLHNMFLFSDPFMVSNKTYVAINNFSASDQSTLFVINIADASVYAKALVGDAVDFRYSLSSYGYDGPANASLLLATPLLYDGSVLIPTGQAFELNASNTAVFVIGASYVTLNPNDPGLFNAVEFNSNLVLNGGYGYGYDGEICSELGFHLFPEIVGATVDTATGPGVPAGTYYFKFTYKWSDAVGNIYESKASLPQTVTTTGTSSTITLAVKPLPISAKNVEIHGYVSTNGSTYNEFVSVTSSLVWPTPNDPTQNEIPFVYSYVAAPTGTAELYEDGGVLGNEAPPAFVSMTIHNNRIWIIPSESRNTVLYTKTAESNAGVNFSEDLEAVIDSVAGECVTLSAMDDKLVVFEERSPLVLTGDGANDTGTGSTLSNPSLIPADTGASYSKGVIVYPQGVIVKTPKGIYRLDRSLTFSYFGADVEQYNGQDITSCSIIADKNQIRFLTSSGSALVYDYFFGQWSTFTNHQALDSCVWKGVYILCRTDGDIYYETPGVYLDNTAPIAPVIQTAWLGLGGIQGFERVRLFEMLGQYASGTTAGHGVQVSAAYDFESEFSDPIPYTFDPGVDPVPNYQYREFLPRQKCDTITLLIQEIVTGDSAEYVTFTDMSFEAGVKKGTNKLAANRSVG